MHVQKKFNTQNHQNDFVQNHNNGRNQLQVYEFLFPKKSELPDGTALVQSLKDTQLPARLHKKIFTLN